MPITLLRIDDRLIHGQIVEGWLRSIDVNCIIVVNNAVAGDEMQCSLYGISVPSGIRVECLSVSEAAADISCGKFDGYSVLLLTASPQDALELIMRGLKINSINVGGMHYSPGKTQLLKSLSVNKPDVEALKKLSALNVELEGRVLPMDARIDIMKIIRDFEKGESE
jgi:mannose/fructose/N-acetylgalactosamine-specific phosphotransferase system component IIB